MNRTFVLVLAVLLALPGSAAAKSRKPAHRVEPAAAVAVVEVPPEAPESALKTAWVQLGPNGQAEVRVVMDGAVCPHLAIDLNPAAMQQRAAADEKFPTLCSASLPPGARQAALVFEHHIIPLPLPVFEPKRILVIGDGGCRIKGGIVQDCRDPASWPFPRVAAAAARFRPDLIIHVGDYPSREQLCPAGNASCAGMPYGDNWPTWDADFFTPAAPLLAAAPVVFVRGNHEDCQRNGAGFLRLLAPGAYDPAAGCIVHLPPYFVPLGGPALAVLDDSAASDQDNDEAAAKVYAGDLKAPTDVPGPVWLVLHRPIFGVISGPLGVKVGGNRTMIAALPASGIPAPVELMVSGHIHSLEMLNYAGGPRVPPQLVAGIGGDTLSDVPDDPAGSILQGSTGVAVADGFDLHRHGFVMLTRQTAGWRIEIFDPNGDIVETCLFLGGSIGCPKK
jgi:hypothetical protein